MNKFTIYVVVRTCFATGRAKFIRLDVFKRPLGGQWAQRAARKTGSGGRQRAPQKLQAGERDRALNIEQRREIVFQSFHAQSRQSAKLFSSRWN
jgi:hypothetical protein